MKPKEHQQRIAEKLKTHNGQILYWDLGSGKTFGAINAAKELKTPATVITPASLQENFKKEIRASGANPKNFDIRSYDKFIRDKSYEHKGMLILDEAHKLRNPGTKRSQEITRIAHNFDKRLLLTGTPIQDKPSEIAALVNVASGHHLLPTDQNAFNKVFLRTYTDYPTAYERLFKNKRPRRIITLKNQKIFKQSIDGLVDYHSSRNPIDYPEVKTEAVNVPMTREQVQMYNFYEGKLGKELKRKMNMYAPLNSKEAAKLNAFLSATRQISNTNIKYGDQTISPKITSVMERIKKDNGPTVVYSNYLESGLYPIANELKKHKISYGVFTGELDKETKADLVNQYNSGKIKTLLVSSSGGEGLDLKNTRAVHLLEPHWNNPKLDQVVGRAVRYKSHESLPPSQRNVKVYKYVSVFPERKPNVLDELGITTTKTNRNTADEYLYNLSDNKEKVNKLFLDMLKQEGSKPIAKNN